MGIRQEVFLVITRWQGVEWRARADGTTEGHLGGGDEKAAL